LVEVFRVYVSQGRDNYAELELPARDYEMLDLMERLRLEPGQLPYAELLEVHEQYDYLERCIRQQPDIFQLNALARKLAKLTSVQELAAFEELVGMDIEKNALPTALSRLVDFAYSTDCCVMAANVMTDYQLGKFLVENDFIEEANSLPDSMLALLDYAGIGTEHREREGGVYTGFGYVEQLSDIQCVSATMDFQPRRPAYTVLLNTAALPLNGGGQKSEVLQLRLPAPEEQLRAALEKLGRQDWNDVAASIQDCAIPDLNHELYLNGEIPQIVELSQRLSELDARGELPKYKAILAANDCRELSEMIALAGTVDIYFFEPQMSSPEDVARSELGLVLCGQDAETLLPYLDLQSYGRALLERDQAVVTRYGLVEQDKTQQTMEENQAPGRDGMEMM